MRSFLKSLSACAFLCCCALFGIIGYAEMTIPDEYNIMAGDALPIPMPYTVVYNDMSADGVCVSLDETASGKTEYAAQVRVLNAIPVKELKVTAKKRAYVMPVGTAFGIKLYTQGVVVVKTDEVAMLSGVINPAADAGIRPGDIITAIDGRTVESNGDVSGAFADSGGRELTLSITRGSEEISVKLKAALSAIDGKYRVGIWVRDSSAGIGTLTFFDKSTGNFAGLGHAVCDVDTGKIMPLSGGEAVSAVIKGSYKGESGTPGELCGVFGDKVIGTLTLNSETGVYGKVTGVTYTGKQIPVAMSYEIRTGPAQIISEINDQGARYYDVEITKVFQNTDAHQKNMVIRVVDETLINETGGIVQGMSGSPIIQNGMLAGAVTHVFINNPLQGYAIFAQTMVETESAIEGSGIQKAS
ncbi:MAG: SpoIVB peptidase [Oscillospiraceae bacterium]|nr:SpoIVB peptidase [Oscillospiraceae bacterium]